MPLLIAGAAASAATAGVQGSTVLIPRVRQLPEHSLQLETTRQKLLAKVTFPEAFFLPLRSVTLEALSCTPCSLAQHSCTALGPAGMTL